MEIATFAGGCFWCMEAVFKMLRGVSKVTSGYSGGHVENPSYEQVCDETTGHAESIQIEFDPKEISYKDLLYVFFRLHDPTTLNRQGNDIGESYRSAIFYHNAHQKKEEEVARDEAQKNYKDKIVTEISPFKNFYEAENYHKDYYAKNQGAQYCQVVIDPKIDKLKKDFKKYLASKGDPLQS